ncbi:hypothetical protein FZEAL_1824 [Fusarium zealandicum]|uniref:Lariat debranching enzyme C-terminal domain-containing protein n=1 Tax=Fusarium zealandicum TaxID=1053134 RepID=A0A8H4USK2_9HYPO|nr:hypothetical protein FZEAL_1824 [Fusarium zealandicum]
MTTLETTAASSGIRLKVAVVGCGHGELDKIYATLETQCAENGWALSDLDFLIICGDFQAVRNDLDLNCMSVPRRYRKMGDFHKYYSGTAKAPVLTLVIGGNHEAPNYFFELYHGGWLAPNIYYLGAAGVVRYGPCRISGLSGIFNASSYHKPHNERLPYDRDLVRTIYHVREYDVQKLLQVTQPIDIALSHDWPSWVELFGDHEQLFAQNPHFLASAKLDKLGNKPGAELMNHLRPSHWFSGHMHTRFSATVEHRGPKMEDTVTQLNLPDELQASLSIFKKQQKPGQTAASSQIEGGSKNQQTKFLALSKAGPDVESYMELTEIEIPSHTDDAIYTDKATDGKFALCYDQEWLAITRAYNDTLRIPDPETLVVPHLLKGRQRSPASSIAKHRTWVKENIVDRNLLRIPENFVKVAPDYDPGLESRQDQPLEYQNPQTARFTELLGMANRFCRD